MEGVVSLGHKEEGKERVRKREWKGLQQEEEEEEDQTGSNESSVGCKFRLFALMGSSSVSGTNGLLGTGGKGHAGVL